MSRPPASRDRPAALTATVRAEMRCAVCDQGDRRSVRRAKLAERDRRVTVVLEVPMMECLACGARWLDWSIAGRLEQIFDEMLAGDADLAVRRYEVAS